MTARRSLQPLSPLAGKANGAIYSYTRAEYEYNGTNGAEGDVRDDQSQGSIVSGLTNLEEDADEFERQMIQNARDERRLNSLAQGSGRVVPFRKARTRPGVALTMDNLERNERNGRDDGVVKTQVKFESPASSNGSRSESVRSDPAVQPPAGWGRKSRKQRDWLRTITSGDEQEAGAQDDTIERLEGVDMPVNSGDDSPLSRKSSLAGTPASTRRRDAQLDRVHDWGGDFTMEFNEASMIASTPYIPRNNLLEDIRTREIESLKEQAVATSRLDKIRETSPEAIRRPRSSSALSTNNQTNGPTAVEQPVPSLSASEVRRRRRDSWKTIGRSQVVTGEGSNQLANSPVLVYTRSSETVGIINRDLVAKAPTSPKRPAAHRREDSHDLLRRLARVSNTPSPGRTSTSTSRPQTASATQSGSSSQVINTEDTDSNPKNIQPPEKITQQSTSSETVVTAPSTLPQEDRPDEKPQPQDSLPTPSPEPETADMDATPMPIERSMLSAKTPQVMGGWVETPAPTLRISRRPTTPSRSLSRSLSRSPKKGSPSKRSPQKQPQIQAQPQPEEAPPAPLQIHKPTLPNSALSSILSHAKSSKRRQRSDDLGDSTINSLEDLITPGNSNSEVEEDTLLGLQIPTEVPKTEAERQRQQELIHLYGMNQRLRAARTSIRDASRGMKRVENQVEHSGEGQDGEVAEDGARVVYKDCPCATAGHQTTSTSRIKSLFSNPKSKWWGLTWLSLFLIGFFLWFISENVAWYVLSFPRFPHLVYTELTLFTVNSNATPSTHVTWMAMVSDTMLLFTPSSCRPCSTESWSDSGGALYWLRSRGWEIRLMSIVGLMRRW